MIQTLARNALALFTLCLSLTVQAGYSLNVITSLTQDDPMYQGMLHFKAGVESRSKGKLEIRIFVGSQLGNDTDILEQARAGANVAVLVDGGRLAVYTHELGILGAPYIASGYDEVRFLVTSDLFKTWEEKLRKASGHQILSFNWWQGERHLLTNKPILTPEDLKGVRMRTPGAPVWLETIRGMGATPTPLGWTEIYSGLQQRVIDAAEAQHPGTYGSRLYEVISHITKTAHINLITGLVGSVEWFDGLPKELQVIVREEALKAGDYASQITANSLDDYEYKMRQEGVTITEIDVTPFIKSTESAYDALGYTELREIVRETLKQRK